MCAFGRAENSEPTDAGAQRGRRPNVLNASSVPGCFSEDKEHSKGRPGRTLWSEDVHASQLDRHDERPAAGDPAFAAIKRAQNELAFRVPCVFHRCSSSLLLCSMLCQIELSFVNVTSILVLCLVRCL
jgi:hypothetical protein